MHLVQSTSKLYNRLFGSDVSRLEVWEGDFPADVCPQTIGRSQGQRYIVVTRNLDSLADLTVYGCDLSGESEEKLTLRA